MKIAKNENLIIIVPSFFVIVWISTIISRGIWTELFNFPSVLIIILPFAIITLLKPHAGLMFFLFYILSGLKNISPAYSQFLSLSILLEVCLIVSLFIHILHTGKLPNLKQKQTILLLIFLGVTFISCFVSGTLVHRGGGARFKFLILSYLIFILIVYFINTQNKLALLFRTFTLLGITFFFSSITHIYLYGLDKISVRGSIDYGFLEGIFDVNELAVTILMLLPLIYYQMKYDKSALWRRMAFICFFLLIFNVIITFSRNGFVSLIIVLSLLFIKEKKTKIFQVFIPIFIAIIIIIPNSYWSRMSTLTKINFQSGYNVKFIQLKEGFHNIKKNPFLGVGYGKSATIHNTFMQVAIYLGLPVFLLFSSIILATYKKLKKLEFHFKKIKMNQFSSLSRFFIISLVAYLIGGLSISIPLFYPFFIILALIATLENISLNRMK